MTTTAGRADTMPSAKQAALAVIERLPPDAYLDEIVDALWTWSSVQPGGDEACTSAANWLLAINPAELVMAGRAAQDAKVLGMSRQIALDVVHALREHALLEEIPLAVATWHWPDDSAD